ncbi:YcaO-like family protein [Actinoallomurus sp. NPDC052274]|uniref:YcaO-like family protein n=1 Tax=Actinoallomurus sp. NPDC052274 TaxID=3155420 RepID=UPI0034315DD8
MPDTIAYRTGTYRTADPEETWERVRRRLPRFGITRVADITRLDDIGLPVHVAYRPTGLTYAVSIGTGDTAAQSRVSAVMESIETWHAENIVLPTAARAPASALDLGYDVRALNLAPRSPLTSDVVLDWVSGRGLLTGREILAPVDCIRLDGTRWHDWAAAFFWPTSGGLATGNTEAEAVLHALHELVERASAAALRDRPLALRRHVDPDGCADPVTRRILDALRAASCSVLVSDITGPAALPCYAATVWSQDVPIRCAGFACHVDPAIAVGRAMAEAVLTRLAVISGARDDIDGGAYREMSAPPEPVDPVPVPADVGWTDDGDLTSVIRHCASRVAAVTGFEPFVVRLDHEDIGIPAVKVIAPGIGGTHAGAEARS